MPESMLEQTAEQDIPLEASGDVAPKEGPPDYGINNADLPKVLIDAIKEMVDKVSKQERMARMLEVRRVTKARLFLRGLQYLIWNQDAQTFQVGPTGAGQTGSADPNAVLDDVRYIFNIFLAYEKSFVSVFSQNPPGTRFEAENPKEPDDIAAAQEAEKMRKVIEKFNDPKNIQMDVGRFLWTDPRIVLYSRYVTDGQRFGKDAQGKPKGREVITAFGTLETKVPIYLRELHDFPYLQICTEHDLYVLKATWPDKADKITQGSKSSSEEEYAKLARMAIAEGSTVTGQGEGLQHVATCKRTWLRPSQYFMLSDEKSQDDAGQPTDSVRAQIQALFPDGLMSVFVGDTFCEARNESMDKRLSVMVATKGDGQSCQSIGESTIPLQELLNDLANLAAEYFEYCIPEIWIDEQIIDESAIEEQSAGPGQYHGFQRNSGEPAGDHFWAEPALKPPSELMAMIENLFGSWAQFLSGQLPAVWGGDMEDQKTASGYAMARNQALGLMAIVWLPFCQFYAQAMLNAVKCAAEYRDKDTPVQQKVGEELLEVNIANLDGDVLAFPATSEGFPESVVEKQQKYMNLLTMSEQNPLLAKIMALPDNQRYGKELIGLDLVIPGEAAANKQLREIAILLQGEPIIDVNDVDQTIASAAAAAAVGQPPPPIDPQAALTPMTPEPVEVDPDFDDHEYEWEAGLAWVNSPDGQKAKVDNPQGFENVRLHLLEHKQYMQAQQQPMIPPGAPAEGAQPNVTA
jgi:hypothetical protein